MNERELVGALRQACAALGWDELALARRLGQTEAEVAPAFSGGDRFTVGLLVRIAFALELEVELRPTAPSVRLVGPVPSVVDRVVERLNPHLIRRQPSSEGPTKSSLSSRGQDAKTSPSGDSE